ncbi:hypothetical protein CERSUDRAFT_94626 [Gelatoporia subvermispora B]|uniref:Uncharacterized protein n=1 Tax=Ceriporiopsis subvermispora (strain B) TaxID=914234 RepID=M2PMJ9_CERS8|nr:hypothetical protein CERSUDRAFT_94626 [Gelatoporia subvermispora B]
MSPVHLAGNHSSYHVADVPPSGSNGTAGLDPEYDYHNVQVEQQYLDSAPSCSQLNATTMANVNAHFNYQNRPAAHLAFDQVPHLQNHYSSVADLPPPAIVSGDAFPTSTSGTQLSQSTPDSDAFPTSTSGTQPSQSTPDSDAFPTSTSGTQPSQSTPDSGPATHPLLSVFSASAAAATSIPAATTAPQARSRKHIPTHLQGAHRDPSRNPISFLQLQRITSDPSMFAGVQQALEAFYDFQDSTGSLQNKQDLERMMIHYHRLIYTLQPDLPEDQYWNATIVARFAPQLLPWLVAITPGRDGRAHIKAATLKHWRAYFVHLIVDYTYNDQGQRCGMSLLTTGGLFECLRDQVPKLIRHHRLDRHKNPKLYFGLHELRLVIQAALYKSQDASLGTREHMIQFCAQISLIYFTALRSSSLTPTDPRSRDAGNYQTVADFTIFKNPVEHGLETWMQVKTSLFKNNFETTGQTRKYILSAVKNIVNVIYEPQNYCIASLLLRGCFVYETLDKLFHTQDFQLRVRPEKLSLPMWRASVPGGKGLTEQPALSNTISATLRTVSEDAGLPPGGAYAFRRTAANTAETKCGAELASLILGHRTNSQRVLDNYSKGTENIPLVDLLTGELKDLPDVVRTVKASNILAIAHTLNRGISQGNRRHQALASAAAEAIIRAAQTLSLDETTQEPSQNAPAKRKKTAAPRLPDDLRTKALDDSIGYKAAYRTNLAAWDDLKKCFTSESLQLNLRCLHNQIVHWKKLDLLPHISQDYMLQKCDAVDQSYVALNKLRGQVVRTATNKWRRECGQQLKDAVTGHKGAVLAGTAQERVDAIATLDSTPTILSDVYQQHKQPATSASQTADDSTVCNLDFANRCPTLALNENACTARAFARTQSLPIPPTCAFDPSNPEWGAYTHTIHTLAQQSNWTCELADTPPPSDAKVDHAVRLLSKHTPIPQAHTIPHLQLGNDPTTDISTSAQDDTEDTASVSTFIQHEDAPDFSPSMSESPELVSHVLGERPDQSQRPLIDLMDGVSLAELRQAYILFLVQPVLQKRQLDALLTPVNDQYICYQCSRLQACDCPRIQNVHFATRPNLLRHLKTVHTPWFELMPHMTTTYHQDQLYRCPSPYCLFTGSSIDAVYNHCISPQCPDSTVHMQLKYEHDNREKTYHGRVDGSQSLKRNRKDMLYYNLDADDCKDSHSDRDDEPAATGSIASTSAAVICPLVVQDTPGASSSQQPATPRVDAHVPHTNNPRVQRFLDIYADMLTHEPHIMSHPELTDAPPRARNALSRSFDFLRTYMLPMAEQQAQDEDSDG